MAVIAAVSLLLEIIFWLGKNMKEKRDNDRKSNNKQMKTKISKKPHKLWQCKNGTNILIKLIRLMAITGSQA